MLDGITDVQSSRASVVRMLGAEPKSGDVALTDNRASRDIARVRAASAATRARPRGLPVDSPEPDPIAQMCAALKHR